jgi:hypothetical protein
MRIAHLAIKADDLEVAGEFHERVFGFRDVRQGQDGGVAEVAPRQHLKMD